MADEIRDTIENLAKEGFASTTFGQGSTSQSAKSLDELANADRYVKGEAAKASPAVGFRVTRLFGRRGGL